VNKLILEILPDIETVVNHTSKDKDERHEIQQTLILKLYTKKELVKTLHKQGILKNWLYKVCWNIKIDLHRQRKTCTLLIDPPIEKRQPLDIDNVKTLEEMMSELNHVERIWINIYLDCNLNIRELNRRTKISRKVATERINTILKKWKHLDIYLQQ